MSRSGDFTVGSQPVEDIVRGSHDYVTRSGLHIPQRRSYADVTISKGSSRAMGHAYDQMPDFDKRALPAYHAMREEVGRQYDHLTKPRSKGGMGLDIEVTKDDPYGFGGEKPKEDYSNWSANRVIPEVRRDVQEHNRIKVYSTATTGGHPFFTNDENDMFRGVHDVFGHLGSGRGIDAHGEEAAFQKHASMFTPLARQAMATETRGQNSYLHLKGQFGPQKVGLLPEHMQRIQFTQPGAGERRAAVEDARNENRKQGIG